MMNRKTLFLTIPVLGLFFLAAYGLRTYSQEKARAGLASSFKSTETNGLGSSRELTLDSSQASESELSLEEQLSKLHKIAIAVSTQFPEPGDGPDSSEGLENLLSEKEGHCGHFIYVFTRQLQELGYPYKIYGLTSNLGLAHALIEVDVKGQWVLFDPSNGLYYPHALADILENPALAQENVGQASKTFLAYTLPSFFSDIKRYYAYRDTDAYEHNVMPEATVTDASPFGNYSPEMALDGEVVTHYETANKHDSAFIEADLGQEEKIYRLSFTWYSDEAYASRIKVENVVEGQPSTILETEGQQPTGSVTNILLKKPVDAETLKFSFFDYQGHNRLMVRDIKVFRY